MRGTHSSLTASAVNEDSLTSDIQMGGLNINLTVNSHKDVSTLVLIRQIQVIIDISYLPITQSIIKLLTLDSLPTIFIFHFDTLTF